MASQSQDSTWRSQDSAWPLITTISGASIARPSTSASLDFVATVATHELRHYDLSTLGMQSTLLEKIDERAVGQGGFAIVDHGTIRDNRAVAVKRMRTSSKDTWLDFRRQLNRFSLELLILCHEPLKRHKNIINVLGYCLSESLGNGNPFLALVLEYSSLGNLKGFLMSRKEDFTTSTLIGLAAQVATGLQVLHACGICHGDVKTQNALVFADGEDWLIKLSDFGESRVVLTEDSTIEYSLGTPLMNAPEVRKWSAIRQGSCTIHQAIQTDVFSFGLLTWEVLKKGSSFFEKVWCSERNSHIDDYDRQEYIDRLPHDGLLSKACDYVLSCIEQRHLAQNMQEVMSKALRDNPSERSSINEIRRLLLVDSTHAQSVTGILAATFLTIVHRQDCLNEEKVAHSELCTWGVEYTVSQLRKSSIHNTVILETSFPFKFQELVLEDLNALANSETCSLPLRRHAAMCIAEFYCSGFGVSHDKTQVVAWVLQAAQLGCMKALAWYPRICEAHQIAAADVPFMRPSVDLETSLTPLDSELYLSNRIRSHIQDQVHQLRLSHISCKDFTALGPGQCIAKLCLFGSQVPYDLSPLHLASLLGYDHMIPNLLRCPKTETVLSRGFTAVHFACIGGHLSTLQLLLDENVGSSADDHGITPLHLCIFFGNQDVDQAASLLLSHGEQTDKTNNVPVYWEQHGLELKGTPLEWAVRVRHRALVKHLLPFAQNNRGLRLAITNFFWEIVTDIAEYAESFAQPRRHANGKLHSLIGDDIMFSCIYEPFSHWIAHGQDKHNAMEQTWDACQKHRLVVGCSSNNMMFSWLVLCTPFEDNLIFIANCTSKLPSPEVKRPDEDGRTALSHILIFAKEREMWLTLLKSLIGVYNVEELETEVYHKFSYLHLAVLNDTVLGARLLLERGVDVNQRTFSPMGDTALSLYNHRNARMQALLLESGAKENMTDKAGAFSLLVNNITYGQAEEGIIQRALSNTHTPVYGQLLHETLLYILGFTFHDGSSWSHNWHYASLPLKLSEAEIQAFCCNIECITAEQSKNLEVVFDDHHLVSIRQFSTLDSAKRQNGLSFTLKVGPQALEVLFGNSLDDLIGEDVVDRLLLHYNDSFDSAGEHYNNRKFETPQLSVDPERSHQFREELFKLQLGTAEALNHINATDKFGMTMLQVATLYLNLATVTSLLEAGADAGIPFNTSNGATILPLQIACAMGRLYKSLSGSIFAGLGSNAMAVALELLRWHHARGDHIFEGTTELHLACRMLMVDEIDELRSNGCPHRQLSNWPGFQRSVLCQQLAHDLSDDLYAREILDMRDEMLL